MRKVVQCYLCATALVYLSACGSSGIEDRDDNGEVMIAVYLPYVESISWPESITADQPFKITVNLSAQLKPEILQGLDSSREISGSFETTSDRNQGIQTVKLNLWIDEPLATGALVNEVEYEVQGLPSGTHRLKVWTADSREWGGLESRLQIIPSSGWPAHEHALFNEYSITVLPPEE